MAGGRPSRFWRHGGQSDEEELYDLDSPVQDHTSSTTRQWNNQDGSWGTGWKHKEGVVDICATASNN